MLTLRSLRIFIFSLVILTSCKSYLNDTIDWGHNIERGTPMDSVKAQEPDFLRVDWENPIGSDSTDTEIWYEITYIKRNRDMLGMRYFLAFDNEDKFISLFAKK